MNNSKSCLELLVVKTLLSISTGNASSEELSANALDTRFARAYINILFAKSKPYAKACLRFCISLNLGNSSASQLIQLNLCSLALRLRNSSKHRHLWPYTKAV